MYADSLIEIGAEKASKIRAFDRGCLKVLRPVWGNPNIFEGIPYRPGPIYGNMEQAKPFAERFGRWPRQ